MIVAAVVSAAIAGALIAIPSTRYGWIGERFVWIYVGTLWLGGLKVFIGSGRPVAEITDRQLVLRPLHQFRTRELAWESITGTEQMVGGDRLMVFYETQRGPRLVALNLNLVKGRREFVASVESRLRALGFHERVVERSRYLTRAGSTATYLQRDVE